MYQQPTVIRYVKATFIHIDNFETFFCFQFRTFHELISREMKLLATKVEYNSPLIEPNSQDVGKQIKMTETFLDKFEPDIYDWLTKHQRPVYAASLAPQRNSSPNRFGPILRLAGNLYRKLFKTTN